MNICQKVKESILDGLKDALVIINDPQNDQTHLEAIVVSDKFKTMSLVKQHQIVMNSLKSSFDSYLHALKLKTYTHEKWNKIKEEL